MLKPRKLRSGRITEIIKCLNCNTKKEATRTSRNKYCSNNCQLEYEYKVRIEAWKAGTLVGCGNGKTLQLAHWLRRYLLEKYNYTCIKCGWNKRHPIDNLPLVEINHIDGNAENCLEKNLEVICPNCHSETPNFRARNKESTRDRTKN